MKSILTKIAIRKAVGVYLGEHELAVAKVVSTPLGIVEIASTKRPYATESIDEMLRELVRPLLGRKGRVPVAIGLPSSRVFFGTRPMPNTGPATPESFLQRTLCSSNISVDELVADLICEPLNKQPVTRAVACRKKYLANIVSQFQRLGVRPVRSEPAACAMARLAERLHRLPRRAKMVLMVFLGETRGMAVTVAGGLPVAWKTFGLTADSECFAILSAARCLKTQQSHYGIEDALDYAIVHGRPDLHERLQQDQLPTEIGTRVIWHETPALSATSVAAGLAHGCLMQDVKAFDLSHSMKTRAPIKEIFPWGDLAFSAGLVGCMGLAMFAHIVKLNESFSVLRVHNSQHACLASADVGKLTKTKKFMEEKVKTVRGFLDSRVSWSSYTSAVAARLPRSAEITIFSGKSNAREGSLRLQGVAPLEDSGSLPGDITDFLNALSGWRPWKNDFPTINTEIKLPLGGKQKQPEVDFTILCQRQGKKGGKS
ncbi:MAG: hypothetical protein LLF97_07165 [Planctomycetaceae bacterium]|nr:hypothetical protein [Planctomycetaceae bacterium]